MVYSSSVIYPAAPNAKFDMSYYLKTHMPLVEKHWMPHGLEDWQVVEFANSPLDGSKSPYTVHALLTWKDEASMLKCVNEYGKEVFGDVSNFSSEGPTFLTGTIVGTKGSKV